MKQHAIMYMMIMYEVMDEAVTCTRWWCVRKREENIYYTTICTMTDAR